MILERESCTAAQMGIAGICAKIRFASMIHQEQASRRYDAASATHAEKWLIIGTLDRENGYGCRRASELFPSPEKRQSVWLFDSAGRCSDRFGADNSCGSVPTRRN